MTIGELATAKPDEACAQRDAALDALSALLAAFRRLGSEYSSHEQQCALAQAKATLADAGRGLP